MMHRFASKQICAHIAGHVGVTTGGVESPLGYQRSSLQRQIVFGFSNDNDYNGEPLSHPSVWFCVGSSNHLARIAYEGM